MTRPIAIISTGHTFNDIQSHCGDFHDWIRAGLGPEAITLHLDATAMPLLPEPSALAGVVISGSHAMVTEQAAWSEALAAWMREAVNQALPLLGICYGHQLLAHALGGQVGYHPQGLEIGTHDIQLHTAAQHDPVFAGLPAQFPAHLVHAQSVLQLPPQAQLLASTAHEPHQAFRVGPCAWGVQFHPEFSVQAMRGYLACMHWQLPAALQHSRVRETQAAAWLLRRFAQYVHAGVALRADPSVG